MSNGRRGRRGGKGHRGPRNPKTGRCSECGFTFRLDRLGNLRHHLYSGGEKQPACKGSGHPPKVVGAK